MNWTEIAVDWKTWVAVYLLILVIPTPPTIRRMTKNWKVTTWLSGPDMVDIVGHHIAVLLMLLLGPVTIFIYWVVYRVCIRGTGCLGLGYILGYILGNLLPETSRWPSRREKK